MAPAVGTGVGASLRPEGALGGLGWDVEAVWRDVDAGADVPAAGLGEADVGGAAAAGSTGFFRSVIAGVVSFALLFSARPLPLPPPEFDGPAFGPCGVDAAAASLFAAAVASTLARRCAFTGLRPRSRCNIRAAAAMLPLSRVAARGFFGASVGAALAGCACAVVVFDASLLRTLTASRVAFSTSLSLFPSLGAFLWGSSDAPSFDFDLPDADAA